MRRYAATKIQQAKYKSETPYKNNELRRQMLSENKIRDKNLLDVIRDTTSNKSELDVYMLLECEPIYENNRTCIETDTAPIMKATKIRSMASGDESYKFDMNKFYIPLFVIDNKEWVESFPRYESWLCGRIRFPDLSTDDNKIISLGKHLKK